MPFEFSDIKKIAQKKKLLGIIVLIGFLMFSSAYIVSQGLVSSLIESGPQYLVNGLIMGGILSLGAVGLTTVYKILGFPNFAHGDFLTFGGYMILFFSLSLDIPIPLSVIAAIALGIVLVTVLEKTLWKPLRKKGAGNITMLIASIGLALFLRNFIRFLFGSEVQRYPLPVLQGFNFAGITMTLYELIVVAMSVILMFVVYLLLTRTKMGKAMRALSDNKSLARVSGINVNRVILFTWIIGVSLAVVAGLFYGIITNVNPTMGWTLLLPLFASVILGGIGNPYGAMMGGMIVGISQEISLIFLPSEYKAGVSFALIIIFLLWKPTGLMGD